VKIYCVFYYVKCVHVDVIGMFVMLGPLDRRVR